MKFIVPETSNLCNFTHRTKRKEIADKIVEEGFEFIESLQKTTDSVMDDPVHLQYWHNLRERYGDYTIVISISKELIDKYIEKLNKIRGNYLTVEQVMVDLKPYTDQNEEIIYTMPREYIKGYFCTRTGEIVHNPKHNPFYDSPNFERNIEDLS